MAWKTKPGRFNLRLVRAVRNALSRGEECGMMVAESYRLFVTAPEAERAEIYTISLIHHDEGTCMATCRELPEVLVLEQSESKAIAAAHAAVKTALAARDSHSDLGRRSVSLTRGDPSSLHQTVA